MALVTPQGVTGRSLVEYVTILGERFQASFGDDLDLSPETPQGQLIGILALALAEQDESIVQLGNAMSLDHASGNQLDDLGSLLDVNRVAASRSRVTATLTGTTGTGIPAGTLAATTGGDQFETLTAVVLADDPITVEMQATKDGPVQAKAGTLVTRVTLISGWATVTNAADAVLGVDKETDAVYRARFTARTANSAMGPVAALSAAIAEAQASKWLVEENNTAETVTKQNFRIYSHSSTIIAQGGTDESLSLAIELHRGLGSGIVNVIHGGAPTNTDIVAINNGSFTWDGTEYSGVDFSGASTGAAQATVLQNAINDDTVVVTFWGGAFHVFYPWEPNTSLPQFGTGSTEVALGLTPAAAAYPQGPFSRPVIADLTVTADVAISRVNGFPADGLNRMRQAAINTVEAYRIGQSAWANDILCALETVPGTQVTNLTVQDAGGNNISGSLPNLHNLWRLPSANLTLTLSGA